MQKQQSQYSSRHHILKTTVSVAALSSAILAAGVTPASAQSTCSTFVPMTGDTVTCTFDTDPGTNDATPITTAIIAPDAQNVDLTIIDPIARSGFNDIDAVFSATAPTTSLGGGSSLLIRNATISNAALIGEGELSLNDFGQVFKPPYDGFFNDYIAAFDDGATPTRAELQQILDTNGIDYTLADTDPVDDVLVAFAAAFNDAGVDTSIGFDEDGDTFIQFAEMGGDTVNVFGLPASGEALEGLREVLTDADGAVISLEAATDRSALTAVIERFATAPGSPAAVAAGQNVVQLGVFGSDDGNIFAIGANGIDLAQGSVSSVVLNDDGISVVGNDGAGIVLNAGGADTSALELVIQPGADVTTLGDTSAAVRVIGGNAVVGIASDLGTLATLGNNSPLVSMIGGNSILNLRLNELSTDATLEYDFGGPYITFGANSPLFEVTGDNSRVFLSSNQVGTRNPSDGFVSLGNGSSIFDWQLGDNAFVNADLLNSVASTAGDGSSILHLTAGDAPDTDVLFAGNTFETTGANAAAILIDATANAGSQDITLSANTITTQGVRAAGVDLTFGAVANGDSTLALTGLTVITSGDFANGIVARSGVAGGDTSASTMTGSIGTTTVSTTGRFANALVVGENVTVYGPGIAAVSANGDAKLSVDTFEDFSATGQGGRGIQNNGVIEVTGTGITYSAGKTGRIANAGTINGADSAAVSFAGDTNDIFELQPEGMTIGTVDGAGGTDTFILGGEGTDSFDTDLLDTQYVNFEVFEKEDLSTWTLTNDDTRSWEVRGGDLVVGSGTNISSGAASTFSISTGSTTQLVDGVETVTQVRGQLIVDTHGAVTSSTANIAAISVAGVASVPDTDGNDGVRLVNNLPDNFAQLSVDDQLAARRTGSDVIIRGLVTTAADGADGILGTYGADLAPELSAYLTSDGGIQTSGADASAIRGGDAGGYTLNVLADGDSTIATLGDRSSAILSSGDANAVSVNAEGAFFISTAGEDAHGIAVLGGASALDVTLTGNSLIETSGAGASAIVAPGAQSATSIDLSDAVQLRTTGDNATVISAANQDDSTFNLTAQGDGSGPTLASTGAGSDLISLDGGDGSVALMVLGALEGQTIVLTTTGANSDAIDMSLGDTSSMTISLDSADIDTTGANARGIVAAVGGADSGFADIGVVLENSTLNTVGNDADGIDVTVGDSGSATLLIDASTIGTLEDRAGAVRLASGANTEATLAMNATVTTTGVDAVGVTYVGSAGGMNTVAIDGSIATQGINSHAIWLDEQVEDFRLGASVSTTGDNAFGIGADGTLFGIVTTADSSIATSGTGSDGIWLEYTDTSLVGDGSITVGGTITTTGDMAEGIWIDRTALTTGGTTITLTGDIRTEGAQSHGISVFYGEQAPVSAGNAGTIIVSGDIDARGAGSDGIRTYLDNGATTNITIQAGGDVFAPQDGDQSIYLTSLAGASGIATANITVEAASETASRGNVFSDSGFAIAEGNASATSLVINTNLTVAGNVSAGGNDRASINLSTGDDTVTVTEDGFIGGTVLLGDGDDVLTLAGTLRTLDDDALNTGTGEDELIILPTASVTGGIDMGPGEDTLAFDGAAGTVGNVSLVADAVAFAIDVQRIEKRGEGTWVFEGDNIPAGEIFEPAFLLNGTSRVQAQYLSIDTTVSAPARLEGTGGVGNLLNAGTLAPGVDGVGTFTVAGGLTLEPSSVLEIDIAADGTSDLIQVGFDVVLDGALEVNGVMYPTGFPNQQDYVIIDADAEIFGEFTSVTDNLPDLDVTVTYNENDVTISYERGQNESDKSIQANTVQSGLVDGRLFAETLRKRGVLMGTGSTFASNGRVQVAQNGPTDALITGERRYAVWAAVMGAMADVRRGFGSLGYDVRMGGVASGFDGVIPMDDAMVRLGVALGISTGDINSDASGANVDTWHLGAHGVYEQDSFGISAAISYGFQDYDIDRVIPLSDAPAVVAQGEASGSVVSASLGAKYVAYESDSLTISPIAHLEHISAKRDAYIETGAGILNLNVEQERFSRTFLGAGVRFESKGQTSGGVTYRPQLDLVYEYAFGDRTAQVGSTAAAINTVSFTTQGGEEARNQVAVGAGMAVQITDRLSAQIRYDGSYASGFTSHRGSAGLSFSF